MDTQKLWDGFWRSSPQTTLSSNAKVGNEALSCLNAPLCSFDAIGEMHQSQVQFCFGMDPEMAYRQKIGIVGSITRHRHMNPVYRPLDSLSQSVRNHDQFRHIPRYLKMLVPGIVIAEVIAQLDASGNGIAKTLARRNGKFRGTIVAKFASGFISNFKPTSNQTSCMSFCRLKRFNPKKIEIGNFQSVSNIKSRWMPYAYVHRKEVALLPMTLMAHILANRSFSELICIY